ncbi:hypothetical protein [Parasphingorhabdus sp.]|uniref:hypothetical protein n=1 Tax=Parasphingorhabdus sp. TaxID=2709688 RepID=UPI003A95D3B9
MIFRYFLFIPMVMYGIGLSWLILSGEYPFFDYRVTEHVKVYLLFVAGLSVAGLTLMVFFKSLAKSDPASRAPPIKTLSESMINQMRTAISVLGVVAAVFSILYVADGGYEKIMLLGSAIDSVDFRYMGMEDIEGILPSLMELSRRLILPFAILSILSLNIYSSQPKHLVLSFLIIVFLAVSIVNLDRGPILMFIVLVAFYLYSSSSSNLFKLMVGAISIVALGFIGAVFTFLQYNQTDFSFSEVTDTVEAILINRIVLSPVKMAQTWIFDIMQQPLYLEFSRISILWGGDYISSRDAFAQYVAPVGVVGDLYRNLGSGFIFLAGILIGALFYLIEYRISRVSEDLKLPLNFIALILAMYLYYGNIFSLGPFAIIVFLGMAPTIIGAFVSQDGQTRHMGNADRTFV